MPGSSGQVVVDLFEPLESIFFILAFLDELPKGKFAELSQTALEVDDFELSSPEGSIANDIVINLSIALRAEDLTIRIDDREYSEKLLVLVLN